MPQQNTKANQIEKIEKREKRKKKKKKKKKREREGEKLQATQLALSHLSRLACLDLNNSECIMQLEFAFGLEIDGERMGGEVSE